MKADKLTIGTRKNGGRSAIVNIQLPESDAEIATVVKSEAARVRLVQRALRIEMQERSGARDAIEEAPSADFEVVQDGDNKVTRCKNGSATFEAIEKAVREYDASAEVQRTGRPAKPKEVKVSASDLKSALKDTSKLAALLAAQGITLNVE